MDSNIQFFFEALLGLLIRDVLTVRERQSALDCPMGESYFFLSPIEGLRLYCFKKNDCGRYQHWYLLSPHTNKGTPKSPSC